MIVRVIVAICGLVIIKTAINTKNDKTGKYAKQLEENYTASSVALYVKSSVYTEMFFGTGLIVQAIFGSGIGYYIGAFISLLGIILLFVSMRKLVKKNIPYRNENKNK